MSPASSPAQSKSHVVAASPGQRRPRWWPARLTARRLARYNHVLIPEKKSDRDRLRRTALGRCLMLVFAAIQAYSREGRVLWLLALGVGCAGLDVYLSQVHQLFAMLVGLLVASALVRPWFRVRGLRAELRGPARVAVGAPARFDVQLRNEGGAGLASLRVECPFLPWDGSWHRLPEGVALLLPGQRAGVTAEATFQARGEHHLDAFEVGALVPLGLAVGPRCATQGPRFLVLPEVANVTAVQLDTRLADQRGSAVSSRQPGEADIAGVRPYRPGDPWKQVHARTWARTGVPHVRQHFDECNEQVMVAVLVDGREASERAKEATLCVAAGVAARLALHGGGIDALLINDEAFEIRPRTGARALDAVLDHLAVHELVSSERAVLGAVRERLAATSGLVVVSAGASDRGRALVEAARARGLPCRWALVVEAGRASIAPPLEAAVVTVDAVEAGRPLQL
jgi:uncharacterized protein (DUF58 family)